MQSTLDRAAAESNPARARHIRHEITEHYKDTTESNADETQQKKKEKRTTMLMSSVEGTYKRGKNFFCCTSGDRESTVSTGVTCRQGFAEIVGWLFTRDAKFCW